MSDKTATLVANKTCQALHMLSLEECRKLCPSLCGLSDEEVAEVRDTLYELGQLALEDWERSNAGSKNLNWFLPQENKDIG